MLKTVPYNEATLPEFQEDHRRHAQGWRAVTLEPLAGSQVGAHWCFHASDAIERWLSVPAKTFEMADALGNPDHFDWPKCMTCGRAMRLVGIEPGHRNDHASVHTYECLCGVVAVDEVSNN